MSSVLSYNVPFFLASQKKTRRKRRWISPHALGASILGSWLLSQTSRELHLPMLWGMSNAWVRFMQIYVHCVQHFLANHVLFYISLPDSPQVTICALIFLFSQ